MADMIKLTESQRAMLKLMQGYRLVAQFHTGAVLAVYARDYQDARVIDTGGRIYSFSRSVAWLDQHSSSSHLLTD